MKAHVWLIEEVDGDLDCEHVDAGDVYHCYGCGAEGRPSPEPQTAPDLVIVPLHKEVPVSEDCSEAYLQIARRSQVKALCVASDVWTRLQAFPCGDGGAPGLFGLPVTVSPHIAQGVVLKVLQDGTLEWLQLYKPRGRVKPFGVW